MTLQGGPSLYPRNGYQPGLLTHSPQDKAYQDLIRHQFNQVEPGNELKMMSVWTNGTAQVNGHYVARTNLYDKDGPLNQLCTWAESQRPRLVVRGHCMVYNQGYTLPHFPDGQAPLFAPDTSGAGGQPQMVRNSAYTPSDLSDMVESYVRQVVDATMAQNAASRRRYGYRVLVVWDVTNEVVSEDPHDTFWPRLGYAFRADDPWYNNGPGGADGVKGWNYVDDIYRWASEEMDANIGKTVHGERITAADRFLLYYNDYNLEWNASKMDHALNLIAHARRGGGRVDGVGFQAHVLANGVNTRQFEDDISLAVAEGLRFSVTENDCAISPRPGQPTLAEQEANQGREYGEVVGLCVKYKTACDAYQMWGATDDGSWLQNQEATPITRWVTDTRPGPTHGRMGYWPKEGQSAPVTLVNPATGDPNPDSGHAVSNAYDQIRDALTLSASRPRP